MCVHFKAGFQPQRFAGQLQRQPMPPELKLILPGSLSARAINALSEVAFSAGLTTSTCGTVTNSVMACRSLTGSKGMVGYRLGAVATLASLTSRV